MSRSIRFKCLVVPALVLAAACAAAAPATVQISMAAEGADGNDGLAPSRPVATLQTAVDRALAGLKSGAARAEVWVAPGVYRAQRADIPAVPSGKTLVLQASPGAARPVFDGAGTGGLWLLVRGGGRQSGTLLVAGFEVARYAMALNLAGNRERLDRSVSHVTIRGNVFRQIGQTAQPSGEPSTAAIRLVNGDSNTIEGNRFSQIQNLQRCRLLHSIYAAHGSTGNRIEGNFFTDTCGNPVHFRDRSGNNRVVNNSFQDAWADAPVSDWYCDGSLRDDCTKVSGECPSFDNQLEGNRVLSGSRAVPPLTSAYGADVTATCPAQGSGRRFIIQ